eukprot:15326816-Ditylum_brightwellii.AAC.1
MKTRNKAKVQTEMPSECMSPLDKGREGECSRPGQHFVLSLDLGQAPHLFERISVPNYMAQPIDPSGIKGASPQTTSPHNSGIT